MDLMSRAELEAMMADLQKEINYVIEKKIQLIRDQFESNINELEEYYTNRNLSDL